MKPAAWSFSSLEQFKNCPRSYHAQRVIKTVKQEPTEHTIWGEYVHKQFENYQRDGTPLPPELQEHTDYMAQLKERPGVADYEKRIALDVRLEPCDFFDPSVWFRGVIDYVNVDGNRALIVDYKTGKPHTKFQQLTLFAIHTFIANPNVETSEVHYYWTKTGESTKRFIARDNMAHLWKEFIPDLRQYAEAFKLDVWQPRPSGLCGWCPVKDCEFWRDRRR